MWAEISLTMSKTNPTIAYLAEIGNFKTYGGKAIAISPKKSQINYGSGFEDFGKSMEEYNQNEVRTMMPADPRQDFLITIPVMVVDENEKKYKYRLTFCTIYFESLERRMYVRIFDLLGRGDANDAIKTEVIKNWWIHHFNTQYYKKAFEYGISTLFTDYYKKYDDIRLCGLFPLLVYWTYLSGSKEFWRNNASNIMGSITIAIDCGEKTDELHCKSMRKIMEQINTQSVFLSDMDAKSGALPVDTKNDL